MIEPVYYIGVVVDNNDSVLTDKKKLGRVKVRLLPEFDDIQDKDLPWIRPFMLPVANSYNIPEIGDKLYILSMDQYFQNMFYYGVVSFDSSRNQAGAYTQAQKFATGQYPNLKVEQYKDGTCVFRDSSTGDIGVVHKSGTIIAIDGSGKVAVRNDSGSLFDIIDGAFSVLENVTNGANWVGNMGIPLIYKMQASDASTISQSKSVLSSLLKE